MSISVNQLLFNIVSPTIIKKLGLGESIDSEPKVLNSHDV